MSEPVHIDFETRSAIPLDVRGLHNYVTDKSTEVLMAAYAFGEGKVKLWQPHLEPEMPADLRAALLDPFTPAVAWNATFERAICKYVLGIDKPIQEWVDPSIQARYLSIPGSLEDAGKILGLKEDQAKDKDGKRLISLFCEPTCSGGEEGLFGTTQAGFRDWATDPVDWDLFLSYCKRDVEAERTIAKKMARFPLPQSEIEMWWLDQKINEAGLVVDGEVVAGANDIVLRATAHLSKKLKELTGLSNPNSTDQMLEWLKERGYPFGSLGKPFVVRALNGEGELTDEAKEAIAIREQTSKSSVRKYTSIGDTVSADGRLRHQFAFMGASRTSRWASRGINLQNLPRPIKIVEKKMTRALDLLRKKDLENIEKEFKNPLDVVTSTLRCAFHAPKGKKLIVCDLNAIENRVIGYVARCPAILDVFHQGRCPYLDFAVEMYGRPYEELHHEWKVLKITTTRNNAKPATLACGFRLSAGKECVNDKGDAYLSGLRGYADNMGVKMTEEEAERAVQLFRKRYPEVVQLWKDTEKAAIAAVENPGHWFGAGNPVNDTDRQRYLAKGRDPDLEPILSFKCTGKSLLEMKLPSGRSLHYIHPVVTSEEKEGSNGPYIAKHVSYEGREQKSKAWSRVDTHGGKWVENGVQAIARDVLCHGLKKADEKGFEIILHVHDEIGVLQDTDSSLGLKQLEECMSTPPEWAKGQLPLGAEGYEDVVYRKN